MATTVFTFAEIRSALKQVRSLITDASRVYSRMEAYESKFRDFVASSVINTEIDAYVTQAIALLAHADDELNDHITNLLVPIRYATGFPAMVKGFSIDVDDEAGTPRAVITALGDATTISVFGDSTLAVDDFVRFSGAEDSDNNGRWQVLTSTGAVLTLTTVLPGTDNSLDTRIIITLDQDDA